MTAVAPDARIVQADGRSKAYRPLPTADRAAALRAGVDAYDQGDYFLAHELLEPAWMGSDDPAERAFTQGVIKLAAADVHRVRGNPAGVIRNLEGAAERLRLAADAGHRPAVAIDPTRLADAVDARLAAARAGEDPGPIDLTSLGTPAT